MAKSKKAMAAKAWENARNLLDTRGFPTLPSGWLTTYYRPKDGRRGLYYKKSVFDERGPRIVLNLSVNSGADEMTHTLCHEYGHAQWDLLTVFQQNEWLEKHADHPFGAYEAFAEDMMFWLHECEHQMVDVEMFLRLNCIKRGAVA